MIDYRLKTFLTLYDTMNYRAAASALNLTQPAVTQHIHALESEYHCGLFHYDGHRLHRTAAAEKLAVYARTMLYNEQVFLRELERLPARPLRIGATKSIGNYVIGGMLAAALEDPAATLSLTVDNTRALLAALRQGELDFALIEGRFDKQIYGHCLMRREPFVGICAAGHPLSGTEAALETLFDETLLLREPGSGTRAILEEALQALGHTTERFRRTVCVSSAPVICDLAARGAGISFVYEAVAKSTGDLGRFTIRGMPIVREFNYVYLKGTAAEETVARFRELERFLDEGASESELP